MGTDVQRTEQRSERINLRVSPDVDRLLREAAAARHQSLTSFLLDAACAKAHEALDEARRLRLSADTFNRVLDELEVPGEVVAPLRDLFLRTAPQGAPVVAASAPHAASHVDV